MKYLGCAYYPEYWGVERLKADAKLMKEAGINIVRVGEFAWCRMEPEEGRFTLDWLHETARVMARRGIDLLMCTPTATPPAWLTNAYGDTLLVRANGERARHGSRRHYCPSSDTYRRHCERIVDQLSREMAAHKNVVAWQLDNELGPEMSRCCCENCQARFQAWLRSKYGSLAGLNSSWGTGFWSMDYSDWSQVRLSDDTLNFYPSRILDSKRFFSEMMIDFARQQTAVLRRNHPQALVVTNGMGPIYGPIDYYRLFSELDVACDDLYFDIATMDANVAAMNVFRSIKPGKRYWITETGSGALDHNKPPHKDQFRAWAWSGLAHGADAHLIFRWRTCLSGQEQELQGILEHSGEPRHRYQAVKECFLELTKWRKDLADLPLPEAPVAIVQDYNVLWGYESSCVGSAVRYPELIYRLHRELYRRHVVADIIAPDRDLSGYRLVILPSLVMIGDDFAARLIRAVKSGTTVLAVGQTGMRDFNGNYLAEPGPQHLADLLGVKLHGGMYLDSHVGPEEALMFPKHMDSSLSVSLAGELGGASIRGSALVWIGDLELNDGRVLLEFTGDTYRGQPAMVENQTGKGRAVYAAAASLDDELFGGLIDYSLALSEIESGPVTPLHVEVVERGPVTFVVNHTAEAVKVRLNKKGRALIGSYANGCADLPPFGVCVVR